MDAAECRRRFGSARVARLATVGPNGPHLVPIVFVLYGDVVVTAVDDKPKRSRQLQRLANVADDPAVSLLVDVYDDDWDRLWWVRADGLARVLDDTASMQSALDLLVERYEQYRRLCPEGPVIDVTITRWAGWSAR